jgi:hypothetical protein
VDRSKTAALAFALASKSQLAASTGAFHERARRWVFGNLRDDFILFIVGKPGRLCI